MFRKAKETDIPAVAAIYENIIAEEEAGRATTGWKRGIYPTAETAFSAFRRDELFLLEENGQILAAAIFNLTQCDAYRYGDWLYPAKAGEAFVMHTLVVDPAASGRGVGRRFVAFYEQCARERGISVLRMDTNEKNTVARGLYRKLGFREAGIVPCTFNGLADVRLVLLEKQLSD